jgi:hypothetical protein
MPKLFFDLDPQDDFNPGIDAFFESSKKLLSINQDLDQTDDRDSLIFQRLYDIHDFVRERVALDATGDIRKSLRQASFRGSLQPIGSNQFGPIAEKMVSQFQLSMPLEEVNPLHLVEQHRRVNKLGPGGIPSSRSVTEEASNVHPSIFGFISPIEGPECFDPESEVYTKRGWVRWDQVRDDDLFAVKDTAGHIFYSRASRVVREDYSGPMLLAESSTLRLCVTPNHRLIGDASASKNPVWKVGFASEWYGRSLRLPASHLPFRGDESLSEFSLPGVPKTNSNQRDIAPFDIEDWCEFLGWWLSEGSFTTSDKTSSGGSPYQMSHVVITQSPEKNLSNWEDIRDCMQRMKLLGPNKKFNKSFSSGAKQLTSYFRKWDKGCYDKWLPEEVFNYPERARRKLLEALLKGDGRWTEKRMCYCTVSLKLAESVERLAIELGYPAFIRIEQDHRPHVKTVNYVVSIQRSKTRSIVAKSYRTKTNGKYYGKCWSKVDYAGKVYCATVPGGQMFVRGKKSTSGVWTGNSENAGVDARLAMGVQLGNDGNLYQKYRNSKNGKFYWLTPAQVASTTVSIET